MSTQPAPTIPDIPNAPVQLKDYLRRFSLWATNMFGQRLDPSTAAPQLLMQDSSGKVWSITVTTAGTLHITSVALGGKNPL